MEHASAGHRSYYITVRTYNGSMSEERGLKGSFKSLMQYSEFTKLFTRNIVLCLCVLLLIRTDLIQSPILMKCTPSHCKLYNSITSRADLLLSSVNVALFGGASTLPEAEEGVEAEEGAEFFDGVRFIAEAFVFDDEAEEEDEGVEGVEESCCRYNLVIRSERRLCAVSNLPTTYTVRCQQ